MKLTLNFTLHEFFPPEIFEQYGQKVAWFLDPRLPSLAQVIRNHFGKPVIINNWHTGGAFRYRGFRPEGCGIGSAHSQHRFGRAIDFHIPGLDCEEIRREILKEQHGKLSMITAMEQNTDGWVHVDIRNTMQPGILLFSNEAKS